MKYGFVLKTKTWIFHSKWFHQMNFWFLFGETEYYSLTKISVEPLIRSSSVHQDTVRLIFISTFVGSYAKGDGEKNCTCCPHGIKTIRTGGSSLVNCSYCEENVSA